MNKDNASAENDVPAGEEGVHENGGGENTVASGSSDEIGEEDALQLAKREGRMIGGRRLEDLLLEDDEDDTAEETKAMESPSAAQTDSNNVIGDEPMKSEVKEGDEMAKLDAFVDLLDKNDELKSLKRQVEEKKTEIEKVKGEKEIVEQGIIGVQKEIEQAKANLASHKEELEKIRAEEVDVKKKKMAVEEEVKILSQVVEKNNGVIKKREERIQAQSREVQELKKKQEAFEAEKKLDLETLRKMNEDLDPEKRKLITEYREGQKFNKELQERLQKCKKWKSVMENFSIECADEDRLCSVEKEAEEFRKKHEEHKKTLTKLKSAFESTSLSVDLQKAMNAAKMMELEKLLQDKKIYDAQVIELSKLKADFQATTVFVTSQRALTAAKKMELEALQQEAKALQEKIQAARQASLPVKNDGKRVASVPSMGIDVKKARIDVNQAFSSRPVATVNFGSSPVVSKKELPKLQMQFQPEPEAVGRAALAKAHRNIIVTFPPDNIPSKQQHQCNGLVEKMYAMNMKNFRQGGGKRIIVILCDGLLDEVRLVPPERFICVRMSWDGYFFRVHENLRPETTQQRRQNHEHLLNFLEQRFEKGNEVYQVSIAGALLLAGDIPLADSKRLRQVLTAVCGLSRNDEIAGIVSFMGTSDIKFNCMSSSDSKVSARDITNRLITVHRRWAAELEVDTMIMGVAFPAISNALKRGLKSPTRMPPMNPDTVVFADTLVYFHQTLDDLFVKERAQRGRHMFVDDPGSPRVCVYPMPFVLCDNSAKIVEHSKWRVVSHSHNAVVGLAWELGFFRRDSEGRQLSRDLYFIECAGTIACTVRTLKGNEIHVDAVHPKDPHSHKWYFDKSAGMPKQGPPCQLPVIPNWSYATRPLVDGKSPEDAERILFDD